METRIQIRACIAALYITLIAGGMEAQVTIGLETPPARAALLELKTQEAANPPNANDEANETSTQGGLLLPRVMLVNPVTLEPFIPVFDPDWVDNVKTQVKELHAGLTVYNLADDATFKPGFYTWNGQRWIRGGSFSLAAGNGLSDANGVFRLGGTLSKPTEIGHGSHSFSLAGAGTVDIAAPVHISGPLSYTHGQPSNGRSLTSDAAGNASWQDNVTVTNSTPVGKFSANGSSDAFTSYTGRWEHTGAFIELPPGRWMIMVTVLANITGVSYFDRYWLESTFVRDGLHEPDSADYVGSTRLVSGSLNGGYNIISGYVVVENKSSGNVMYNYCVGQGQIPGGSSRNAWLDRIGSKQWGENSIVAFSLVK